MAGGEVDRSCSLPLHIADRAAVRRLTVPHSVPGMLWYALGMLKRHTVWLNTKDLKQLADWAKKEDRSVGWLIRKIVVDALTARRKEQR